MRVPPPEPEEIAALSDASEAAEASAHSAANPLAALSPEEQGRLAQRMMRRQGALSLRVAAVFTVLLLGLPLVNYFLPELANTSVFGFSATWLFLGVLFYPITVLLSLYFVKHSDRIEAETAKESLIYKEKPMTDLMWIPLLFVLAMIAATVGLGVMATRQSKTASDFFVAGRSVSVFWNASAISGEYLSAASFLGIAGLVMKNGYDALWYPVCYATGYLFLLLFIAGPLRRFGAYTIPDFAEGRFDSPLFRKIAVTFVLFIGFFYTMPQMKGAGITIGALLGWPYWAGIAVVGCVITFNVALGGMKGITLVQALQYWAKIFAISAPVFILIFLYGGYSGTLARFAQEPKAAPKVEKDTTLKFKGKKDAPANAASFSTLGLTRMFFPDGVHVYNITPTVKMTPDQRTSPELFYEYAWSPSETIGKPGYKSIKDYPWQTYPTNATDDRLIDTQRGQIAAGGGVSITSHDITTQPVLFVTRPFTITEKGQPVLKNGKPVKAAAKVEFDTPTAAILPAGSYVPNAQNNKKWLEPFGTLTGKWEHPILYTYSLIIALICGTAGLPHILVRFYTNPDGRAAKRTTLLVMGLLGAFYVFTPLWGALGRAVLPALYANNATDQLLIKLPGVLENHLLGAVLMGVTSAGAFAAFMSTFSGLLVSMSGAVAHDIYGKILRPHSSPQQRLVAFKWAAVVIGIVSMLLGLLVESFDIAMLVGWAFAIAAASYFPLLLLGAWWRGLTKYGAAAGMLTGGTLSMIAIVASMLLDKKVLTFQLDPLIRSLMEQPAIWGVPLSIGIMIGVSLLTAQHVPKDIAIKMLRLHAPEEMGFSRNYIEH